MKKFLSLLIIIGFTTLIGCGPSAEEKAAAEKMRQDSINAVMAQMATDSMNAAQALVEKARLDSMEVAMKADSILKAEAKKKPVKVQTKPKPKTTLSTEGTPKVGKKKPGAK